MATKATKNETGNDLLALEHREYLASNRSALEERGWVSLSGRVGPDGPESIFSFYRDAYGAGEEDCTDILVSYLPGAEHLRQEYRSYPCGGKEQFLYFLDSIKRSRGLIFQGDFRPFVRKSGDLIYNAQSSSLRALSRLCIDVDPLSDPSTNLKHPLTSSDCLSYMLDNTPESLMPSYISLSGSGIHLWYVFTKSVESFGKNTMRRRKLSLLQQGLYQCFSLILDGFPVSLDPRSQNIYHAFAAPGSLSKFNDEIPCFYDEQRHEGSRSVDPNALFSTVASLLGKSFAQGFSLTTEDLLLSREELNEAWNRIRESKEKRKATDKQRSVVIHMLKNGMIPDNTISDIAELSAREASELISSYMPREKSFKTRKAPERYMSWTTKPHVLQAGKSGGVYNTILGAIPKVEVGHRYASLNMLAGVAYMMVNPVKPISEVREDFIRLVNSPWGQAGEALTLRDVENALKGYCPDNWQTVDTEIQALGFSPFSAPAKRNKRSREEHLGLLSEKKVEKSVQAIYGALVENPSASKAAVAKAAKISRSTVYKHWDKAISLLSVDVRSSLPVSARKLLDYLLIHPEASKLRASKDTGLSRTTVDKYWERVKGLLS